MLGDSLVTNGTMNTARASLQWRRHSVAGIAIPIEVLTRSRPVATGANVDLGSDSQRVKRLGENGTYRA